MSTTLQSLLEPAIQAMGFELVDLELVGAGKGSVLRLYIDKPGGITLDDCADVSRQVSAVLDVEDPIPGHYTLEVSSPGLDRPLVKMEDFRRHVGEQVKLKLSMPTLEGRRNFKGRLLEAGDSQVTLQVDNEEVSIAYADIEKARCVPEFD